MEVRCDVNQPRVTTKGKVLNREKRETEPGRYEGIHLFQNSEAAEFQQQFYNYFFFRQHRRFASA
jgi:hypothetical protein